MTELDIIIVGAGAACAGSAGAVPAKRLSENFLPSLCLLEAKPRDTSLAIRMNQR